MAESSCSPRRVGEHPGMDNSCSRRTEAADTLRRNRIREAPGKDNYSSTISVGQRPSETHKSHTKPLGNFESRIKDSLSPQVPQKDPRKPKSRIKRPSRPTNPTKRPSETHKSRTKSLECIATQAQSAAASSIGGTESSPTATSAILSLLQTGLTGSAHL